jgi:hypothetical protein
VGLFLLHKKRKRKVNQVGEYQEKLSREEYASEVFNGLYEGHRDLIEKYTYEVQKELNRFAMDDNSGVNDHLDCQSMLLSEVYQLLVKSVINLSNVSSAQELITGIFESAAKKVIMYEKASGQLYEEKGKWSLNAQGEVEYIVDELEIIPSISLNDDVRQQISLEGQEYELMTSEELQYEELSQIDRSDPFEDYQERGLIIR